MPASWFRRLIPLLPLVPLALATLACHLVSNDSTPAPPTPAAVASSGAPTVTVLWPPFGSEFAVRQEVTVHVSAADEVGVTRIELRSASAILSSVPSPERGGQSRFEAILSWTPTRSGQQDLEVVAYRRRTASEPVPLTLFIRQRASDIIATPIPFGFYAQPATLPANAACQVRVDIDNLRYRTGPGTDYAILGLLDLGEVLSVTGRNSAGTWWQINRNDQTAWVSSEESYSTELSSCAAAPVMNP